jgi:hypothetical protein
LEYTIEELFVEYMEDIIETQPHEAFPPAADGDLLVFRGTGDKVIDSWEAEIASGKAPDVMDAFKDSPDVLKWLTKSKKKVPTPKAEELPEDFRDDFTGGGFDGDR